MIQDGPFVLRALHCRLSRSGSQSARILDAQRAVDEYDWQACPNLW